MPDGEGRVNQTALARALGLSPAAITKLKRQGMPITSVRAAMEWRTSHLRKDLRTKVAPASALAPTVQEVEDLGRLAAAAAEQGRFHLVERDLRKALAGLSCELRQCVRLPVVVWDRLTGAVASTVESAPGHRREELAEAEAQEMGAFWMTVACGEAAAAVKNLIAAWPGADARSTPETGVQ